MTYWTTEELRRQFDYDPETGIMTRKTGILGHSAGAPVGTLHHTGYVTTKSVGVHRLAWQYVYGTAPPCSIDHINGDRADNRISNLRLATNSQNQANRKAAPSRGASWNKSCQKWQAQIKVEGRSIYLGLFATQAEAQDAYARAALEHFGDYARPA